MARGSSLPDNLRYWQPFRRKFSSCRPEDLNEDTGMQSLLALMSKRIKGLSQEEAEKLVGEDWAALKDWLALPAQLNDPLHFVYGVFLIFTPATLVQHLREAAEKPPEPEYHLEMDLPPDAKVRKVPGSDKSSKLFVWQGLFICVVALSEKALAKFAEVTARSSPRTELSVSRVCFQEVTGTKYVRIMDTWRGTVKTVDYFLAVPGRAC